MQLLFFCIINHIFTFLFLHTSSDEEYARRVQMQNEWVVRQVDNMQDYKQSLLFSLAANLEAEVRL